MRRYLAEERNARPLFVFSHRAIPTASGEVQREAFFLYQIAEWYARDAPLKCRRVEIASGKRGAESRKTGGLMDTLIDDDSGECKEGFSENEESCDDIVLVSGLQAFEVGQICKVLGRADIPFSLLSMGGKEAGLVNVRPDNVAAALTKIANAFSNGGLGVYYQIRVRKADYERAKELVEANKENPAWRTIWKMIWVVVVAAILLKLLE